MNIGYNGSSLMKLQQLRCLAEVARRGLNVSEAAGFTSNTALACV